MKSVVRTKFKAGGRDSTSKRAAAIEQSLPGTVYRLGEFTEIGNQKVCVQPDILLSVLYAHTRKMRSAESAAEEDVRPVVGTLLGTANQGVVLVEDSFVNAVEFDAQGKPNINLEHHAGVLDMKGRAMSTAAGQHKEEVVGMIIDRIDFDLIEQLNQWILAQRGSRFTPTVKLPAPVFICIDTSLKSGRLDIRAYQRDRNGIMLLESPLTIGHNFPKSVVNTIKKEIDHTEVGANLNNALQLLVSTLETTKMSINAKDSATAREVYNTLCINPLMEDLVSLATLEKVTGDSMALAYLLRLTELQAEIAKKLA